MKPIQYKIQKFDPNKKECSESEVLENNVELMKAACEMAGVEFREPSKGEWFFGAENKWWHSGALPGARAVIPAPDPEPCPNCQNIKPGIGIEVAGSIFKKTNPLVCELCGRPESEWTYAPEPDWAGIGSGIM